MISSLVCCQWLYWFWTYYNPVGRSSSGNRFANYRRALETRERDCSERRCWVGSQKGARSVSNRRRGVGHTSWRRWAENRCQRPGYTAVHCRISKKKTTPSKTAPASSGSIQFHRTARADCRSLDIGVTPKTRSRLASIPMYRANPRRCRVGLEQPLLEWYVHFLFPRHVLTAIVTFCWSAVTAFAEPSHPSLSPTNIFAPVSTPAQSIFDLSLLCAGGYRQRYSWSFSACWPTRS